VTSSISRLVVATRNPGKLNEIRILLGDLTFPLVSLMEFKDVGTAEELEPTYEGNAVSKAKYYSGGTREFVIADDSGLEVEALNGAPGVLSARYAGPGASDQDRRNQLLTELTNSNTLSRTARFVCCVALAAPNQTILQITRGICDGTISNEERGTSGFGYDPVFIPNGYQGTFGELSEELKNQISHRARAIAAMKDFLLGKNRNQQSPN